MKVALARKRDATNLIVDVS